MYENALVRVQCIFVRASLYGRVLIGASSHGDVLTWMRPHTTTSPRARASMYEDVRHTMGPGADGWRNKSRSDKVKVDPCLHASTMETTGWHKLLFGVAYCTGTQGRRSRICRALPRLADHDPTSSSESVSLESWSVVNDVSLEPTSSRSQGQIRLHRGLDRGCLLKAPEPRANCPNCSSEASRNRGSQTNTKKAIVCAQISSEVGSNELVSSEIQDLKLI